MNKIKLKDVAEITMGQSPESKFVSTQKIGLPLLNGPAEFSERHPNPVQYTSSSKRLAEPKDILFCVRGSTTGRINVADQKYSIGRGLASIRHKKHSSLNTYVKAILQFNLKKLLGGTLGSVFPNLTKENLFELEFFGHDLKTQEKISSILSTLDNKISINNQINDNLERMAKTLYDYWFVQFDFPDENGKPYKSSGGKMIWNE
ncbi:restriction endonuclease subunit S, partial [Chryseobacterium sp. 2TAF14]|uniref:restriction endonuclease subunit S n=1 Tax=Chryseobacterium sp. 2TAF14 TaxID=3233007 RepID=UPI003F8E206B